MQPQPADDRNIVACTDRCATVEAMRSRQNNRPMGRQANDADVQKAAERQARDQDDCEKQPNGNESEKRHAAAVYASEQQSTIIHQTGLRCGT